MDGIRIKVRNLIEASTKLSIPGKSRRWLRFIVVLSLTGKKTMTAFQLTDGNLFLCPLGRNGLRFQW